MQGDKLRGTKLRSSRIFSILKQDFETFIVDVKTKLEDSFELVFIETSRGTVECKYYKAEEADKGIVLVGGMGGGFQTPADSLYPRLGEYFKETGVSSLNIKFRETGNLSESVTDVLVGIEFLKSEGIRTFGLIGYSFGGAVVVQAAFNETDVKTLVLISTQSYGIDPISFLPKETSVFIIHGEEDEIIPPEIAVQVYEQAHEPKRVEIFDTKASHDLDEIANEIYIEVIDWITKYLINKSEK
jgi:alpha/beta superfamily hydrolase